MKLNILQRFLILLLIISLAVFSYYYIHWIITQILLILLYALIVNDIEHKYFISGMHFLIQIGFIAFPLSVQCFINDLPVVGIMFIALTLIGLFRLLYELYVLR